MPWPLIQDSTTLSPAFTLVTALPVSSTVPVPSWPRQCGTHLSSPLSPRHSITWVPQAPENAISTSTWPGLRAGISISARTRGFPVWTSSAASVFIYVSAQCVKDFVGDLVCGKAQHLAGIFLLAGFLEERIWRAEAQEFPWLRLGIGEPFGDGRAEAADQRVLFQRSDQSELCEGVAQAVLVERLHGVEAHDLGRDAVLFQPVGGLDRLGQHVAGRKQADVAAYGDRDGLADRKLGQRTGMH